MGRDWLAGRRWNTPAYAVAAALFVLAARPSASAAHGMRLPFAAWGGFDAATLHCQRELSRAAANCAQTAWRVRRECRLTELSGGPVCRADGDPRVSAARAAAQDAVDDACTEHLLGNMQFLGVLDAGLDLNNFCVHGWADAADSLVFPSPAASDAPARACAAAAADAASDVLRYVFRGRRRWMDRAAARPLQQSDGLAFLAAAARVKAGTTPHAAARLAARCPDFAARYGRSPDAFVALLVTRADCIGGAFYIQDAVTCPAPVCGNGVVEYPPETCDDGNTLDGDACPADCNADD